METTREAELFARVRALEAVVDLLIKAKFPYVTDDETLQSLLGSLRRQITEAVAVPIPERGRPADELVDLRMESIERWLRTPLTDPSEGRG